MVQRHNGSSIQKREENKPQDRKTARQYLPPNILLNKIDKLYPAFYIGFYIDAVGMIFYGLQTDK
jgi:hypothetical protein